MYQLQFLEKKSKNFPTALKLARQIGCTFEDGVVTIQIENVLEGYRSIRQIFSYVQNWKGTQASYNGIPVQPYRFLLEAEWIGQCYDERLIDQDCGTGFGCRRLNIEYHINRPYFKKDRYWYNYGRWEGKRWIIDKKKIFRVLMDYANKKAIIECPLFDETRLLHRVNNLPEYLVDDGFLWETVYEERFLHGELVQIPHNIKHRYPERLKGKPLECWF